MISYLFYKDCTFVCIHHNSLLIFLFIINLYLFSCCFVLRSKKLFILEFVLKFCHFPISETKPVYSPSTFNRNTMERIIIGGETEKSPTVNNSSRLSTEILKKYEGKSREVMKFCCISFLLYGK